MHDENFGRNPNQNARNVVPTCGTPGEDDIPGVLPIFVLLTRMALT